MQIKEQIFEVLRTNYSLREYISHKIKSRPVNIERWGQRKSIPSWFESEVIILLKEKLNLTDKEIYQ